MQGALADFTASIKNGGEVAGLYVMRAGLRHENGDVDGALEDAARAAALGKTTPKIFSQDPGDPMSFMSRGEDQLRRWVRFSYGSQPLIGPGSNAWAEEEAIALLRQLTEHADPQIAELAKAALGQVRVR